MLPRNSHITDQLSQFCHAKMRHMGRGTIQNEPRQRGYWFVGRSVSDRISKCVTCSKLRGPAIPEDALEDLSTDRVEPSPHFLYWAVGFFGPFLIKERRSELKRYGVIFTCMVSRGVHLETAKSLKTSSFINELSRFLYRRRDQGTNFVGEQNKLKAALEELDQDWLRDYLSENGCEWLHFQMNVPHTSHMGGSWERLICIVRSALETLLLYNSSRMHCQLQTTV